MKITSWAKDEGTTTTYKLTHVDEFGGLDVEAEVVLEATGNDARPLRLVSVETSVDASSDKHGDAYRSWVLGLHAEAARVAVEQWKADQAREAHAAAAGALCVPGDDGCCAVCSVSMTTCHACGGTGYHRRGCAEMSAGPCDPHCPGWGVFNGTEIQRCDECGVFADDVAAGVAASTFVREMTPVWRARHATERPAQVSS